MIAVDPHISLNGVGVKGHNTILDAGFNMVGKRIFQPTFATQALWIRYCIDGPEGNIIVAGTYGEVYPNQHVLDNSSTLTLVNQQYWYEVDVMLWNVDEDAYIFSRYWIDPPIAVVNADVVNGVWNYYIINPNNAWTDAGMQMIGHRCFDSANTYLPVSKIKYYNGVTLQKSYTPTYTKINNQVHNLAVTTDADITADSIKFTDSSDNVLWNLGGSARVLPTGFVQTFSLGVSQ